jgi:hypothetical protein
MSNTLVISPLSPLHLLSPIIEHLTAIAVFVDERLRLLSGNRMLAGAVVHLVPLSARNTAAV